MEVLLILNWDNDGKQKGRAVWHVLFFISVH